MAQRDPTVDPVTATVILVLLALLLWRCLG
jgi:hypothetical protein